MRISVVMAAVLVVGATTAVSAQTRITKVSSSDVRVRAGGEPAQLTLEGVAMSEVTSVRLLSRGGAVRGLAGTIATRGRTSRQLILDLTADASVPAGTYQLEVVAGRQSILVPVAVTVQEMMAATATPSITGANRGLVKLKADDPAETVILEGSSLDLVTGAHVQQDGRKIPGIRAKVRPGANPTRRLVDLSAAVSTSVPWDQPLDLVVEAPNLRGLTVAHPTPVKVSALGTLPANHGILSRAINNAGVLSDVDAYFKSCGSSDGGHMFVALHKLSYSAGGSVPRRRWSTTHRQRVAFFEKHTKDPSQYVGTAAGISTGPGTLSPAQVRAVERFKANEFRNPAHPNTIPHSLSAVRMCLMDLRAESRWRVTGVEEIAGVPHLVIAAGFADARFRLRGMPLQPWTGDTGLDIGIPWGDEITDKELPDRLYDSPKYEVRLPMEVANGQIHFGSPTVNFVGSAPRWSAVFLGPSNVRGDLEKFAEDRIQQIRTEVTKVFNAANTRSKLASVTAAHLKSVGVTEMLGIEKASDGTSRFLYR